MIRSGLIHWGAQVKELHFARRRLSMPQFIFTSASASIHSGSKTLGRAPIFHGRARGRTSLHCLYRPPSKRLLLSSHRSHCMHVVLVCLSRSDRHTCARHSLTSFGRLAQATIEPYRTTRLIVCDRYHKTVATVSRSCSYCSYLVAQRGIKPSELVCDNP